MIMLLLLLKIHQLKDLFKLQVYCVDHQPALQWVVDLVKVMMESNVKPPK